MRKYIAAGLLVLALPLATAAECKKNPDCIDHAQVISKPECKTKTDKPKFVEPSVSPTGSIGVKW